jgi:hypothetical protein
MNTKIIVNPKKIRVLGDGDNKHFCLITNHSLVDCIQIEKTGNYLSFNKIIFEKNQNFADLLSKTIPTHSHILVISPEVFFQSPPQNLIGENRKLIALACNSTPTSIDAINHFLKVIEETDPAEQQLFANRFFEIGEKASYLEFLDEPNQTKARFNHLNESYLWSEQAGDLNYGEQQLAPAGEISVLPLNIQEFDENLRLDFNGSIALRGFPILHNGSPSFMRSDQLRLFNDLSSINSDPIIANIENGIIVEIESKTGNSSTALSILQSMFSIDSRYRILWEIGFGINTKNHLLKGNHAMNETYGGSNGAIHFGLGLTPFTQYHLDIICPDTRVFTDTGDYFFGKPASKINRIKTANCPCNE